MVDTTLWLMVVMFVSLSMNYPLLLMDFDQFKTDAFRDCKPDAHGFKSGLFGFLVLYFLVSLLRMAIMMSLDVN